jgi:DmsE family decaheme c-type cytochrome
MVSADWVNEKCLACHTEKRGPFLWEHAPVRESCLNCHDAHGSNHDKLLVAKQPYLCQRCHLNTRHPGTLYDARNTVAAVSVSNRAVEHSCRNCHQNVHGGNAPSGPYLGR